MGGTNWSDLHEHGPSLQLDPMSIKFDPHTYRITSIYDGTALDVRGCGRANGTQIITYAYHGGPNQRWKARLHDGGVILSSEDQGFNPQNAKAIQLRADRPAVQLFDYMNALNQKWYLEEVEPSTRKFLIRNIATTGCLQNNGHGQQVTVALVETAKITTKHIWKIDSV